MNPIILTTPLEGAADGDLLSIPNLAPAELAAIRAVLIGCKPEWTGPP